MNKKGKIIVLSVLAALSIAAAVLFGVPVIHVASDAAVDTILLSVLSRLPCCALLVVAVIFVGDGHMFVSLRPDPSRALVWSIPCILVAAVNFPFCALISGAAQLTRPALVPLVILECIAIALVEELFFRGLLFTALKDRMRSGSSALIAVLVSSAVFALVHLVNLFYGADVSVTLLQVGYTFLIGCMLAVMLLVTDNILFCTAVHALFDFGGKIVPSAGEGTPWDIGFWIITAVCGALCAVHVLSTLFCRKYYAKFSTPNFRIK